MAYKKKPQTKNHQPNSFLLISVGLRGRDFRGFSNIWKEGGRADIYEGWH